MNKNSFSHLSNGNKNVHFIQAGPVCFLRQTFFQALYFMFLLHFKKKDTQRMTLTTIKVEIDLVYLTLFSSQKLNTEL